MSSQRLLEAAEPFGVADTEGTSSTEMEAASRETDSSGFCRPQRSMGLMRAGGTCVQMGQVRGRPPCGESPRWYADINDLLGKSNAGRKIEVISY